MAQMLASSSTIPSPALQHNVADGSKHPCPRAALRRVTSHSQRNATPALVCSSFKRGIPLVTWRSTQKKYECKSTPASIRCEQSANSNGLDVWLGRLAMIGFAAAVAVEITTGKGLLENFGFTEPLPTVALGITGLVGVLTAFFIFQSATRN